VVIDDSHDDLHVHVLVEVLRRLRLPDRRRHPLSLLRNGESAFLPVEQ
jgi:hypothetical protein